MDANKLKKLQDIDYAINPSCGTCVYSSFPNNDWGLCANHEYNHMKHDGIHKLSIHRLGSCPKYLISEKKTGDMQHYKEFFK